MKTHYMNKGNLDLFDRVILLIRNPYTCILSHFNFVRGGQDHVGHARNQYFLNGGELNSITKAVESCKLPALPMCKKYKYK